MNEFERIDYSSFESRTSRREIIYAEFCWNFQLLATVQPGCPIKLSGIDNSSVIDLNTYALEEEMLSADIGRMPVVAMAFSQNRDIPLLAFAFQDGDLAVFDYGAEKILKLSRAEDVSILASTPDGHTLAAGDSIGHIKLYNFDSLELLHTIPSISEASPRAFAFSGNEHRLFDI